MREAMSWKLQNVVVGSIFQGKSSGVDKVGTILSTINVNVLNQVPTNYCGFSD